MDRAQDPTELILIGPITMGSAHTTGNLLAIGMDGKLALVNLSAYNVTRVGITEPGTGAVEIYETLGSPL